MLEDRRRPAPATAPAAGALVPGSREGNWGIAQKLWLWYGFLFLILALSGLVTYRQIQNFDRDLTQIVAIEEPLEEAVLEMEINAGETARAVLDYVRDLEIEHLAVMRDSEADFERFAAQFERLVETDEERRLGRKVAWLYAEFKRLGDEIVVLADQRMSALQAFRTSTQTADGLLDGKLKPLAKRNTPSRTGKLGAVADMDEFIDDFFPPMESYLIQRDPAPRQAFNDAQAEFEGLVARYRETGISAEEAGLLDRIERQFSEAMETGIRTMAIVDQLDLRLDELEEDLEKLDTVLDDEIQPLIHAATVKAADHAKATAATATLTLLALGGVALSLGMGMIWSISRGIIGPIRTLAEGAEIIGKGRLDHRIDIESKDELGHLAKAFNQMAERIEHSANILRENEARFRDFTEAASDWFWEMDSDLRFTHISDHFFETFGLKPEAVLGKTRTELAVETRIVANPENWRRHFEDLEAHRAVRDFEYSLIDDEGKERHLSLNCVPVFDDAGTFSGYRGTDTEITEKKRAERLLVRRARDLARSNDELERFASVASHDLQEPLRKVQTFGDRLKRKYSDVIDEQGQDYIDRMRNAAVRMQSLIEDLLNFSRVAANAQPFVPVNLSQIMQEVLSDLETSIQDFDAAIDIAELPTIEADPLQMRQLFQNLIGTALKFRRMDTAPTLKVEAQIVEAEAGAVNGIPALMSRIKIADNGMGFDEEYADRIFGIFKRLHGRDDYEGTGVGLAICRRIAERHNGSITASSRVGHGATFVVTLPTRHFEHGVSAR